jgi:hypothetical protein
VESAPRHDLKGIRVVVKLPSVSLDPDREFRSPDGGVDYNLGPLDRPSVYVGGSVQGHECAAGLIWDQVHRTGGIPAAEFGFRTFWRTSNDHEEWHQPKIGTDDDIYFRPGDVVVIKLAEVGPEQLRVEFGLIEERESKTLARGGMVFQTFRQDGFGLGAPESFKRASSIDQFTADHGGEHYSVEGRDVYPTHSLVKGIDWRAVTLLGPERALACDEGIEVRHADIARRYDEIFKRSDPRPDGSEVYDIVP